MRGQATVRSQEHESVTVRVRLVNEELGNDAETKVTLPVLHDGNMRLLGLLKCWDAWGLWDQVSLTQNGGPYFVMQVNGLQDGATYLAVGPGNKRVSKLVRQAQIAGRRANADKLRLEEAIVREVCEMELPPVEARPDLCHLQSLAIEIVVDAVALGLKYAIIAKYAESVHMTPDRTSKDPIFQIIHDVWNDAQALTAVAGMSHFEGTMFAEFKGLQIISAVMYEDVDPKLQPALETACASKGVWLFQKTGTSFKRLPAVKPVAMLGTVKPAVKPVALLGTARRLVPLPSRLGTRLM